MSGFSVGRRSMRRAAGAALGSLLGATFLLGGGCTVLLDDLGLDVLFPGGSVQTTDQGVDVQAPGVSVVVDADSDL